MKNKKLEGYGEVYEYPFHELNNANHFLTGSRRWGTHNKASDVDIAIGIDSRQYILNILRSKAVPVKSSVYNNGFSFYMNGFTWNIIPLHPIDFVSWYKAADMMCVMINHPKETIWSNKIQLYAAHEMLKASVKSLYSFDEINIDNYMSFLGEQPASEENKTDDPYSIFGF